MTAYRIPVHSVIDLITNSSSESFVTANEKSLATVKAVINETLRIAGSSETADDLVTLSLSEKSDWKPSYVICEAKQDKAVALAALVTTLQEAFPVEEFAN